MEEISENMHIISDCNVKIKMSGNVCGLILCVLKKTIVFISWYEFCLLYDIQFCESVKSLHNNTIIVHSDEQNIFSSILKGTFNKLYVIMYIFKFLWHYHMIFLFICIQCVICKFCNSWIFLGILGKGTLKLLSTKWAFWEILTNTKIW